MCLNIPILKQQNLHTPQLYEQDFTSTNPLKLVLKRLLIAKSHGHPLVHFKNIVILLLFLEVISNYQVYVHCQNLEKYKMYKHTPPES